jgi:hypothetical protein
MLPMIIGLEGRRVKSTTGIPRHPERYLHPASRCIYRSEAGRGPEMAPRGRFANPPPINGFFRRFLMGGVRRFVRECGKRGISGSWSCFCIAGDRMERLLAQPGQENPAPPNRMNRLNRFGRYKRDFFCDFFHPYGRGGAKAIMIDGIHAPARATGKSGIGAPAPPLPGPATIS